MTESGNINSALRQAEAGPPPKLDYTRAPGPRRLTPAWILVFTWAAITVVGMGMFIFLIRAFLEWIDS